LGQSILLLVVEHAQLHVQPGSNDRAESYGHLLDDIIAELDCRDLHLLDDMVHLSRIKPQLLLEGLRLHLDGIADGVGLLRGLADGLGLLRGLADGAGLLSRLANGVGLFALLRVLLRHVSNDSFAAPCA
jgi:hypothetical protein